ncbi:unnamed protein product [Heterobilharzia americana]|nr:unnamed protein product [Heterobilharzia americana]
MGLCRSTKATFFYYDFTFVVTFLLFSTYLLYELCLLESDFLLSSYFLDIAVYQSPWFIIFLMIFLYFIDMLACEINEEFNRWDTFLVHKLLGDKKKLSILFYTLILLTFTLCPLFSLSLLKHANLTVFLVSTSIFLLFSDLNLFLEVLKYCSLEVILGNCKDAEQNCSFLNHLLSNPLFVQHILSMFLKTSMLILCVTSRYPYILENIFRFTLVEQVTCMVTLFVFMPSFVRMLLPFSTQRISQEERKYLILDEKLTSSTRRRSYSCSSHHSSYMGRSP